MEEQKNNTSTKWIILGIIIIILIGVWVFNTTLKNNQTSSNNQLSKNIISNNTSSVKIATSTIQSHFAIVNLRAENGQFIPKTFTVSMGKVVMINFTAIDNTYDFGFADPKIGFDVIVKKGETQSFGFDTADKKPGEYIFHCIQYCPKNGTMEGPMTIK